LQNCRQISLFSFSEQLERFSGENKRFYAFFLHILVVMFIYVTFKYALILPVNCVNYLCDFYSK